MTLALSTRGYLSGRGRAVKVPRRAPGTISVVGADRIASVVLSSPTVSVAPPPAPVPATPSVEVSVVQCRGAVPLRLTTTSPGPAPSVPLDPPTVTVSNVAKPIVVVTK